MFSGLTVNFLAIASTSAPESARVAAGRRAVRSERGLHRVEDLLARADRVLVAREADDARLDRLQRRLERVPQAVLASARADPGARGRAGRAGSHGLNESASCQHGSLPYRPPPDLDPPAAGAIGRSTSRKMSTAFFISSIVPIEMRQCVFSNGGKSRPTMTPVLGARVAELPRRTADVHEDEVGLRVGRLAAEVLEGLDGERAHFGVARALVVDVLRIVQRRDGRGDAEDADVVRHLAAARAACTESAWPIA